MKIIGIILAILIGGGLLFVLLLMLPFYIMNSSFFQGAKIINSELSNQYYFKKDTIIYVSEGRFFANAGVVLKGIDRETFQVLSYDLAKDKNNVYYKGEIIDNADPLSFELLVSQIKVDEKYNYVTYSKDNNHVYFLSEILIDADTETFSLLWGQYAKDANHVFRYRVIISDAPESVKRVKNDSKNEYVNINNTIFYQNEVINVLDVASYEVVQGAFSKDNQAAYFETRMLDDIDSLSFEVINDYYQRDKSGLLYDGKCIPDSDPSSYEFISTNFSKDSKNIYYLGRILMDKSPIGFGAKEAHLLSNNNGLINLIYDTNQSFFMHQNLLTKIEKNYYSYENKIYFSYRRIVGAVISSFRVLPDESGHYSLDNKNVYYKYKKISNADISTFEVITYPFSKDKNRVYYFDRYLIDIKPDEFVYSEGMYGENIDDFSATLGEFETTS